LTGTDGQSITIARIVMKRTVKNNSLRFKIPSKNQSSRPIQST
jgi:hypothetical protein